MPDNDLLNVFLGRQPILDRQQQLFAYELLFRSGGENNANRAGAFDGNQATATVISNAFTEFSMADALGPYQCFIKVDHGLLFSDLIYALPPHCVVLEILETVAPTPETVARCAELRGAGFVLAIREQAQSPDQHRALLELAEVIKIDISRFAAQQLKTLVDQLKPLGKTLLAEKVESGEQMQTCRALGFDLFEGYYFAHPTVIRGKRLPPSELALLRLLWLLSQDADDAAIEAVFKQVPVLTVNLLRLINSAASGMTTEITSLRHAISLLGRRQLLRWLQLLLYSGLTGGRPAVNPLLQLAATRGRLMELLLEGLAEDSPGRRDGTDQAYMVGILSLMPALFGNTMSEILAQLPVARPVHDALAERCGTLGDLLSLVEALENSSQQTADQPVAAPPPNLLRRLPGIDAEHANRCLSAALAWANKLANETP